MSQLSSSKYNIAIVLLILAIATGSVLFAYDRTGQIAGQGNFLLPVDDVYIHFQYARQIAEGQPYIYNDGYPPTSGATSFIYPYILAVGYAIGFTELNLAYWAIAVGGLTLFVSGFIIYLFLRDLMITMGTALIISVSFIVTGSFSWHFMSGMETGFAVLLSLIVLWSFFSGRRTRFLFGAVFLTLTRPEGGVIANILVIAYLVRALFDTKPGSLLALRTFINRHFLFLLPVLTLSVQPFLNLLLTGSLSASGNQAKSLFGIVPAYPEILIERLFSNYGRSWVELLLGIGESGIIFFTPLLGMFATVGLIAYAYERRRYVFLVGVLCAFVIGFGAIATLDTAFWHFKRYHIPLLAWAFPLSGMFLMRIPQLWLRRTLASVVLVISLYTGSIFLRHYALNVSNIYAQPYSMALWLAANTPSDSVIAVHDVGLMRYFGHRTTLDMVGLTTPGAADYWRNGPGAVAEFLIKNEPDFVASYVNIRGLDYLANTPVFGDLLAGFRAEYDPQYNVALGGDFQGVFQPKWSDIGDRSQLHQSYLKEKLSEFQLLDTLNVADIDAEAEHHYTWRNDRRLSGFISEVYTFSYLDCTANCELTDGGRLITNSESFIMPAVIGRDHVLVTRIHPRDKGQIRIFVDEQHLATRVIPEIAGKWLDIATLIPAELIADDTMQIEIHIEMEDGAYMPYFHQLFVGDYTDDMLMSSEWLTSFQDKQLLLMDYDFEIIDQMLHLELDWWTTGQIEGDYITFVHIYNDVNQPPVMQIDARSQNGTLPPGNWLPGMQSDVFMVDLSQLSSGEYTLLIGFYDPITLARLTPVISTTNGEFEVVDDRLKIEEFMINANDEP